MFLQGCLSRWRKAQPASKPLACVGSTAPPTRVCRGPGLPPPAAAEPPTAARAGGPPASARAPRHHPWHPGNNSSHTVPRSGLGRGSSPSPVAPQEQLLTHRSPPPPPASARKGPWVFQAARCSFSFPRILEKPRGFVSLPACVRVC